MWKLKMVSKSKPKSKKSATKTTLENDVQKCPGSSNLASLFQLQQQRWDDLFAPTNNIDHSNLNTSTHIQQDIHDKNDCITDTNADGIHFSLSDDYKLDEMNNQILNDEFSVDFALSQDEPTTAIINETINTDALVKNDHHDIEYETNALNAEGISDLSKETDKDSSMFNKDSYEWPYYLHNFVKLINSVCNDDFYDYLLDHHDKIIIQKFFNRLSNYEKRLYIRLFLRKHVWIRRDKISYDEFQDQTDDLLESLVQSNFLDDIHHLESLNDTLCCLKLVDLKLLCKNIHAINASPKSDYISSIISHSKKLSISFIPDAKNHFEATILKKAKGLLKQCYRLNKENKDVFMRIFTLAALQHSISDEDFSGQQLIFQMSLMADTTNKHPTYEIVREKKIFASRESLIKYCNAMDIEAQIWIDISKKCLQKIVAVLKDVHNQYLTNCFNEELTNFIGNLPEYLRTFTLGGIYTRILSRGVSVLETLKDFDLAVDFLKDLISQNLYHLNYRGRWYNRLSLNLHFHLKQNVEALSYIEKALSDRYVKAGHRYDLLQRSKKICSSNQAKKIGLQTIGFNIQDDYMSEIKEAPLVYISGLRITNEENPNFQGWLSMDDNSTTIGMRVEQVALQHYHKLGYCEGLHAEGLTFLTLYMLFMWDIVFQNKPDVFINQFQDLPLDFRNNCFFEQRKESITERLSYLKECSIDELCHEVALVWDNHQDVSCSALHRDLFRDLQHLQGLVKCMGPSVLSSIFRRMSIDNRHVFGGVPDLIVWNPEQMIFKIVEVKGPNDKLSAKQILWLDFLLGLNVDAEVCHVKAIKRKRIQ